MQVPLVMQPPHEVWDQTLFSHAGVHWAPTVISCLMACCVCVVVSYSLLMIALRRQIALKQRTGDSGQYQQLMQPLLPAADDIEAVTLVRQNAAGTVLVCCVLKSKRCVDDTQRRARLRL